MIGRLTMWVTAALLLVTAPASAAAPDVRVWTTEDGLPQNSVTDVVLDDDGFLWITTFEGVTRFDGHQFWRPEVTDPDGRSVLRWVTAARSSSGALWFASQDQGLFVVRDGQHFEYVPGSPPSVRFLEASGDTLWAQEFGGLYRCEQSCVPDRAGLSYDAALVELDGAVFLADRGSAERLGGPEVPFPSEPFHPVLGPSWRWDVNTGLLSHSQHPDWEIPVGAYRPRAIHTIGESIWIGTETEGLFRVRESPLERVSVEERGALISQIDSNGDVIVSTAAPLLYRVRDQQAMRIDLAPTPGHITSLSADDQGTIWGATGAGVFKIDGLQVEWTELPIDGRAVQIQHEGSTIWAVGENDQGSSLWRLRPGEPPKSWPTPEPWRASYLIPDGRGGMWYGSYGGAWHLESDSWKPILIDGVPLSEVRDFLVDGEATWIGTYGNGLIRVRGEEVVPLGPEQGLCDHVVSRIQRDGDRLWMNSNRGVFSEKISELELAADRRGILTCSVLQSGEGNGGGGSRSRAPDGRLWFNTIHGIVSVDPARYTEGVTTARVESVRTPAGLVQPGQRLPPRPGPITISVGSTNLDSTVQPEYRYRLRGLDNTWSPAADQSRSTWSALRPGQYAFEAQARAGGEWSEPVGFSFSIARHWTDTPSYRVATTAIALLVLLSLALIAVRWRTAFLARRFDRLNATMTLLGEREGRLRALFEAASNGLLLHHPDGRVVEANPAACWLTEREREELLGQVPADFVTEGVDRYEALLSTTGTAEAEFANHPVLLRSTRIKWDGVWHFLISATDMTEQRRELSEREHLESRLRQTQSLVSIAALSGRIAHDVNDLLALVIGEADLLALRHPKAEPQAEAIRAAAARGTRLTEKLSAFANHGSAHPSVLRLSESIEALLPTIRCVVPESVNIRVQGRAPSVEIDPAQLEKVVMNLSVNAGDAMPTGGTLDFVLGRQMIEEPVAEKRGIIPGMYATLVVRDSGAGIPADVQKRIFDLFFTTKDPSLATGLGLPTVSAVVRSAGGFVEATSELGRGTVFTVFLPASIKTDSAPLAVGDGSSLQGLHVVVCAKDARIADMVSRMVSSLGCVVRTEPDAPSVLRSMAIPTDVLITDARMEHMLGERLAERCREIRPELKVLLLSALGGGEDTQYPVLPKPFSRKELATILIELTSS